MKLYEKTAVELDKMLNDKQISAVELLESVISRTDEVEDKIGSFITQTADMALEQAKSVDKRRASGEKLPALAGIPIAVKDNIGVKGVRMTCASKMLESYVPPFSATVIDKLIAEGSVINGKTNLDEFAMGSSCESSYYKKTRNPHNPDCVPGGSSGGSAAALAAGEAILALGSDTGGSARLPAAFCGVVGLRPTYGAVSRYGMAAMASSLDQISPMGRCVTDVTMLLSKLCGRDSMDATSANREYPDFAKNLESDVKGVVIGIPDEYFGPGVDAAVTDAIMAAVKRFEDAGAIIKRISLPSTRFALAAYHAIMAAEVSSNLAKYDGVRFGHRTSEYTDVNEMIEKSRTEGFGWEVKRRILFGTSILTSKNYSYYKRALLAKRLIAKEFDEAFKDCACLITPMASSTAIRFGENIDDPAKMYAMDTCAVAVGLAGLPAISVPCGRAQDNMPIGMQIIGPKFGEAAILQMAYRHEQASGGPEKLPTIV